MMLLIYSFCHFHFLTCTHKVLGAYTEAFWKLCDILHVKWVLCHHGIMHPQVADGGDDLQIWNIAMNILKK